MSALSRRVASTSALVLLLGLAAPARGATGSTLSLTGSVTASIEINVAERTSLDLGRATFAGKGAFVGFYADRLPVADKPAARENVGAVKLRDFHGPGSTGLILNIGSISSSPALSAGRYRLYLLTEGPATVTIPLSGAVSYSVRPRVRELAVAAVAPDIRTSQVDATSRLPLAVSGRRSITVSSLLVGQFRAFVGSVEACVALPESPCGSASGNRADGAWTGWFVSPLQESEFAWILQYEPGVLVPRMYDGVQGATVATTLQYAAGAAFSLRLRD